MELFKMFNQINEIYPDSNYRPKNSSQHDRKNSNDQCGFKPVYHNQIEC